MRSETPDPDRLDDWFIAGVEAADVTALRPLSRARPSLQALMTVFSGAEAAVMIRLLVLRELGSRPGAPWFSRAELDQQFPYLDAAKLDNLIARLRVNGILAWDSETSRYSISPLGRMLIAAVSSLLKFGDDGSELGYLAGQLAAGGAIGGVTTDDLQHLLARLTELKDKFDRAIVSGSESRIRDAAQELDKVWGWVDKGSEVLRAITEQSDMDGPAHRVAQRIGQVQSELLRMSGRFQNALSKLESQKVHLGATGLSTTDIGAWLRQCSPAQLTTLLDGAVAPGPSMAFALGDIALDIAEFELIDKVRPERLSAPLPDACEAAVSEAVELEPPDYAALDQWRDALRVAPDGWPLAAALPLRDYELSSYRLSLLSILGDQESATMDGPVADLARLDRRLEWTGNPVPVHRDGVAEMSEGRLRGGPVTDGS